MDRKLQFAMAAFLCWLCLPGAGRAQNLPDGPGKAEFIHNCLDCHSAGMVLRAKKTPDEWRKNVDDMASRGSDGSKEDIDKVVLYLDKYFATAPSGPPAAAPHPQSRLVFRPAPDPNLRTVADGKAQAGRPTLTFNASREVDGLLRYLGSLPPLIASASK